LFEGARRPLGIFGVTMDLGHGSRGVDMGPSAIRYARLQGAVQKLGYGVADLGNAEARSPKRWTKHKSQPKL
jgi:arginase